MKVLRSLLGLSLVLSSVVFPTNIIAQSKASSSSGMKSTLNEQEMSGKGIFLQRCSLCHMPPPEIKPKMRPSSGPILDSLFKDAKPDKEKVVREFILKGGPNMPGFQYGLEPKEIDDLIAFLKTLNDPDAYMNGRL